MSMREHQIESSLSRFIEEGDEHATDRVSKPAKPVKKEPKRYEMQQRDDGLRKVIGQAAVRTGIAILAVPDPLPFVDEVAGITLVAGGTYLIATSE